MRWRITLIGLVVACVAATGRADTPDVQAAERAASSFHDLAGDPADIQENLVRPLLSEQPMMSVDGKSFDAQLTCRREDAFLEVLLLPSETGDIGSIQIQHDTTMDGAFDRRFLSPMHASGVCANGIISCTPGSWSECRYYRWTSEATTNVLDLVEAGLGDLGGCYCVNNHCGDGLFVSTLDTTLAAIGGGAAAALAANNPYYAITNVVSDGPVARYFGQSAQHCGQAGPNVQTAYFIDSSAMTVDADTKATTDAAYQLMAGSPAATQSDRTNVECDIRRTVSMDEVDMSDIIDYNGGSGGVSPCGADCLQLVLGRIGDNYWGPTACQIFEHAVQFNVRRPERVTRAVLVRAVWDDWIQVRANANLIWSGPSPWLGSGNPPGDCELSTSWDQSPGVDFTSLLAGVSPGGLIDFTIRVAVAGNGEGYAYARVDVDTTCALGADVVSDGCRAYQSDATCSLVNETVDGVTTVQNFAATGLVPLPSTVTVSGAACAEDVARDWWHKHRRYSCLSDAQRDFSAALSRAAFIQDTTSPTAYRDRVTDTGSGEIVESTGALTLLDEVPVPRCTAACKTRRPRLRNDVGRSGVVSDNNTQPSTFDTLYHECDADGACPIGSDEVIIKECSCIDEFAEASVVMQLVRMSGQDILCSSGTPQPVQ